MRTPLSGAALLLILSLLGTTVRADQKADALLKEVSRATRAVNSLTADLVMTMSSTLGKQKATGKVKLMRPNFARIEIGAPFSQTIVSDGKHMWMYQKNGNQYMKTEADPKGEEISAMWAFPVNIFFDPSMKPLQEGVTMKLAPPETIDEKKFSVIAATLPGGSGQIKLYIGPDKLVHRTVMAAGPAGGRAEATFKNIEIDAALMASDFAYTPPKGAKLQKPPDFTATLIPLGKKAPNFTLRTPAGTSVSLLSALRGKKAVLINFWSYG